MSGNSRTSGLILMAVGAGAFAGTTAQVLPAIVFFPGLVLCGLGVVVFIKGNRVAVEAAEERTQAALNPKIRNQTMEDFAARQAQTDGNVIQALGELEVRSSTAEAAHVEQQVEADEIVLYEVDDTEAEAGDSGLLVSTDVSFPVEVQEQRSLADQLQKLERLHRDGIIDDDEFAIAKAKLLD